MGRQMRRMPASLCNEHLDGTTPNSNQMRIKASAVGVLRNDMARAPDGLIKPHKHP